jgi:bla regulator protein blaR1
VETLLHAALNNAVSAAILALVVACLARVLARRPAVLHCLWLLVLVKLVTPPLYQVSIPWPESLSVGQTREAIPDAYVLELIDDRANHAVFADPQPVVEVGEWREPIALADATDAQEAPAYESLLLPAIVVGEWLKGQWILLAGMIWLAGSVTTAVVCARRICSFQRLLRESRPASDDVQDWVDDLALSLGIQRPPQVVWIAGRLSPMLWALGHRARLIIPTELWKGLDQQERATLIVHELAHLRRGDHHVRLFELFVTVLCWWNPVLWWARQALRDVEEQCCDAWVVWAFPDAARSYAETLLETLDFLNQSELSEPLLASGFGRVHHLRRRLTMIMSGTTPRLVSAWGGLGSLCLAILLLPVNASWAQQSDQKQEVRVVVTSDEASSKSDDQVVELVSDDGSVIKGKVVTIDVHGDGPVAEWKTTEKVGQGAFVVELRNDDSSVNVTAGTKDEAIAKIKEKLKAIKEQSSPSDKDRSLTKALEEVLEQLKQLKAAGAKSGSIGAVIGSDSDAKSIQNFVIKRVETTSKSTSDSKSEIGKVRDEIQKLSEALAAAKAKLSQLEGAAKSGSFTVNFSGPKSGHPGVLHVSPHVKGEATQDRKVVILKDVVEGSGAKAGSAAARADVKIIKVDPKDIHSKITVHPSDHQFKVHAGSFKFDTPEDQRLQDLEKTLKKLVEEVESLKKSREAK